MRYWLLAFLIMAKSSLALSGMELVANGLQYLPTSYLKAMANDVGELCEFAAAEFLSVKYPPKDFYILRNLVYQKNRKRQLGELDIVVFSKETDQAVHLYEVKCRNDEEAAYEHAVTQLLRFKRHVNTCINTQNSLLRISDGFENYPCELFANMKYDVMMPQRSPKKSPSKNFGLSLNQIYFMQNALKHRLLALPE